MKRLLDGEIIDRENVGAVLTGIVLVLESGEHTVCGIHEVVSRRSRTIKSIAVNGHILRMILKFLHQAIWRRLSDEIH